MIDINQFVTALTPLTEKIGEGGSFVYTQAIINQIVVDIFFSISFLFVSLVCLFFIDKNKKKIKEYIKGVEDNKYRKSEVLEECEYKETLNFFLYIGFVIFTIGCLYNILSFFTVKFDALYSIINMVKHI